MCGIPASGKSTWVQKEIERTHGKWISRDNVRFSMVKENEDYFSKENAVFKEFIRQINEALTIYDDVYVDATHINEKSRNKTLDKLNLEGVDTNVVNFKISLKTCLERNSKREGRLRVPDSAVRNMYYGYQPAHLGEKHPYNQVISIKED
jgi:predicted kinase